MAIMENSRFEDLRFEIEFRIQIQIQDSNKL